MKEKNGHTHTIADNCGLRWLHEKIVVNLNFGIKMKH